MKKILLSWVAINNDFTYLTQGNKKQFTGMVDEEGPTFGVHRYFWDGEGYEKHILLNGSGATNRREQAVILQKALAEHFSNHQVEIVDVFIQSPIDLQEIFSKILAFVQSLDSVHIDVFISPGTPAMQVAWYLLETHFPERFTLFQTQEAKYTPGKIRPEKFLVKIDQSNLPGNLLVKQTAIASRPDVSDFQITPSISPIYQMANRIAHTPDIGCLVLGENGTGKEHLARFIHQESFRKQHPFIAVNCAAYNDDLLRSELFGHTKGSFTGATESKAGVFREAEKGTVFLDEIGDISLKMQVTLLRVLQEKKIQAVGSSKELAVDVRVIAATNRNLEEMCEKGEFRWDLYYRLAVTTLELPPLRERGRDEIRQMIDHFNHSTARRFSRTNPLQISRDVMEMMLLHGYRGNVRELENLFLHLYTFCSSEVTPKDLPERVRAGNSPKLTLADTERNHILKVYELNKHNQVHTATTLGITRETLRKRLKEYGVL